MLYICEVHDKDRSCETALLYRSSLVFVLWRFMVRESTVKRFLLIIQTSYIFAYVLEQNESMEITSAEFIVSNSRADMCPKTGFPEFAFIGRSNVGKSSLINMLTKKPKLAMTSSTPGKTLLINHFLVNKEWYLVDLPGYGYAQRGKKMMDKIQKLIEYYILERMEMTCLFVLIDSRHSPQKIDLEFMEWLGENAVPFAIVFTKADKQSVGKTKENIQHYLEQLSQWWETLPPYFITSAEKKTGRHELLDYIEQINLSLKRKIPADEIFG